MAFIGLFEVAFPAYCLIITFILGYIGLSEIIGEIILIESEL